MTEKTPAELQVQRAQLIASTGLTEAVLRERAEAFQLYPEHADVWATVEGIDYLLNGAEKLTELAEAQSLAREWEVKYFEQVEKRTAALNELAHVRVMLSAILGVYRAVHSERVSGHQFGEVADCVVCDHAASIHRYLDGKASR
ncbi:hypothetical protein [Streptomyces sp. BE133]|uniref:hypothetical protein n=1 Tax=Streptomyces sp. BE133 TaxID=3002523 RepID=UPI002E766275|nr:hypothetical protein [Streptomyces sp. BE133]MEE1812636.1 hypothetical protein [Streptomyces sp. BE133]